MLYRVHIALSLLLFGCSFDQSASPSHNGTTGQDASAVDVSTGQDASQIDVSDCDDFVSNPCGDCGMEVCLNSMAGADVVCQPDSAAQRCPLGLGCNEQGTCDAQATCSDGDSRSCGECGTETCNQETWSGECVADSARCDSSTQCFSTDKLPICLAACSTEGFRTPRDDSPAIPDMVPVGFRWDSTDGCDEDSYRGCECIMNGGSAPRLDCDNSCAEDD